MSYSPKKIDYLTHDTDIQPDFFKIMHEGRAIKTFKMKKAGQITGFLADVKGAIYENISLVIPSYHPIDSS
jgi:hypothetical protein